MEEVALTKVLSVSAGLPRLLRTIIPIRQSLAGECQDSKTIRLVSLGR